ncbi:MAG: double-strand break repair protein AddB [Pseudomonadota bacterium]
MFEAASQPRLFGLAPGVDFPKAVVEGLLHRVSHQPPEALARVDLIVNTARMQRRLQQLFAARAPLLLPKIRLLTDLDGLCPGVVIPRPVPTLRRRLELVSLVSKLLDAKPDLAPRTSLYDLTDSLAALMDEMQGEGVPTETLQNLDVSDLSGHWERSLQFISIAQTYLATTGVRPDTEGRQRQLIDRIIDRWSVSPPENPVIVAGSTGSRGTTLKLMEAVAKLRLGALVLPGFDFDQPDSVWQTLDDPMVAEDHPQFRFARLFKRLNTSASTVESWMARSAPSPARNRLMSLSLRPAPVTDAWITDGPALEDLKDATKNVTFLEAPTPRAEALAIALRLRAAAETGQKAALITPDRALTRQVTAALDQWEILPDDSAGNPLHLSPPGRFLRHTAALFRQKLDAESLLTLLKHPLCHANERRAEHVLNVQRLEQRIRDLGLPYPDPKGLMRMMDAPGHTDKTKQQALSWVDWIADTMCGLAPQPSRSLSDWVKLHRTLSEALSAGKDSTGTGELWQKKAGQKASEIMVALEANAGFGGEMSAHDYADLVGALLSEGEVRDRDAPHPDIMIWGTLEARVQGAELVILAGLNEGTWPEAPAADPWLNRKMRQDAGLLLPERRIGLSAHDFQQAVAAPEVWISRAIRTDDAETVVARWVNRLKNLLGGLKDQNGPELLAEMHSRGEAWLAQVDAFEKVERVKAAPRPSPAPPVATRPRHLSVTEIQTLIRDPYAIYAKHVLGLRKTGPLVQTADALLRGTIAHDVLERFVQAYMANPDALSGNMLRRLAADQLDKHVPWPAARVLLHARFDRLAEWFPDAERARLSKGTPVALEDDAKGTLTFDDLGFSLSARADRIDATADGQVILYDYKSGTPPSKKEQRAFNKQLLIEAAMIEQGSFSSLGPKEVSEAIYIGLKSAKVEVPAPLADEPTTTVLAQLKELISAYLETDRGYTARLALQMDRIGSDYDLLSRYGEWNATARPHKEMLK